MKRIHTCTVIVLVAMVVAIALVNIFILKSEEFWKVSISTCLTMIISLVIAYFFTQGNIDERNKKEAYVKVIEKVECIVTSREMIFIGSDSNMEEIKMRKRSLSNYIGILEQYADDFDVVNEVNFVKDKGNEYMNFLGDHIADIDYLKKSSKELSRPFELIEEKLCEITIKLYS